MADLLLLEQWSDEMWRAKRSPVKCERATCPYEDTPVLRKGKKYCSEECADREASGKAEQDCFCGHPDCAAA